ncbi:MAG: hypothetical protein J3K34DRAFT_437495 [Monoraphidium minutum]|nr:MAG: hypothetical protein J3K34DRAFT_437495 [Monoraphidium minutum]
MGCQPFLAPHLPKPLSLSWTPPPQSNTNTPTHPPALMRRPCARIAPCLRKSAPKLQKAASIGNSPSGQQNPYTAYFDTHVCTHSRVECTQGRVDECKDGRLMIRQSHSPPIQGASNECVPSGAQGRSPLWRPTQQCAPLLEQRLHGARAWCWPHAPAFPLVPMSFARFRQTRQAASPDGGLRGPPCASSGAWLESPLPSPSSRPVYCAQATFQAHLPHARV